MHSNALLNKEILKMLLVCLLDLRASSSWARKLWHQGSYFYRPQDFYSLVDQLTLASAHSMGHLVIDRLQSLDVQTQPNLTILLERAQLIGFGALQMIEASLQETPYQESGSFEKKLQETVEALVKVQDQLNRWRYRFFYAALRAQVEFVTRAIRLEMKELFPPQDKVEKGISHLETAYSLLEKAIQALEKNQTQEAHQHSKEALSYRKYSLNHQAVEFFLYLLVRFELSMKKLQQPKRLQKPIYRLYLLERSDKALKHTCCLLRLFHQEARLTCGWNKVFQERVNQNWKQMIEALDLEASRYGQMEPTHWKLWSHASVYRLGLGYSGHFERLSETREAVAWARRDNQESCAQLRLVVALLALIDASFDGEQTSSDAIDLIRIQLETITRLKPALKNAIERSCQDLCLLYTRQEPISSSPVLESSGRLLSMGWDIQSPETVVCCLQCLEDLYDIWAGSASSASFK